MNKDRRKRIARAIDLINEAWEILEEVKDEEEEAYNNMPEGLQSSERGERMEQYIEILEEAVDNLDTTSLEEIVER